MTWQSWIDLAEKTMESEQQSPLEYVEEHIDNLSNVWKLEDEPDYILHPVAMATYVTAVSDEQIRELYQKSAVSMFKWQQKNKTKSYGAVLSSKPYFREIQRIILPRIIEPGFARINEVLTIIARRGDVSSESATKSAERIINLLNSPMGAMFAVDACHQVADCVRDYDIALPNIEQYKSVDDEGLFYILSPALFATMKLREKLKAINQNVPSQSGTTANASSEAEEHTEVVEEDNTTRRVGLRERLRRSIMTPQFA